MRRIVLATHNIGKLKEVRQLLGFLPIEVISLQEIGNTPPIVEDGKTFADNARKKAETIAAFTDEITIADDSGLEVDYLSGAPGVYSARFAGEGATDSQNNAKLLRLLEGITEEKRTARFCCAMALAVPGQETIIVEGFCEGRIGFEPIGEGGFGYDPLFVVPTLGKTFAQLEPEVKNKISHRAKALEKLKIHLMKVLGV